MWCVIYIYFVNLWMSNIFFAKEEAPFVDIYCLVLRVFACVIVEERDFTFCVPRDRWDKEFFILQSG